MNGRPALEFHHHRRHPGFSSKNVLSAFASVTLLLAMLATGCSSQKAPAPAATEDAERRLFREGQGLKLSEETRRSLGVQTAPASSQTVHRQFVATAQVFARRTNDRGVVLAVASAWVPASATRPAVGAGVTICMADATNSAAVVRVDDTSRSASGQFEVVMETEDVSGRFPSGRFVEARFDAGTVTAGVAVANGAVVRAGLGNFVYVAEGEFLKRSRVKLGAEDSAWVEILGGVTAGQSVVTHGAESLWLLELSEVGGMTNIK